MPPSLPLIVNVAALTGLGLALAAGWRQRRAMAELKDSELRYRTVFEQSTAAMMILDADHATIIDTNQAAVDFYGWPRAVLVGKPISEINLLPSDELATAMTQARTGRHAPFQFRHRLADGSIRDVEVFSGTLKLRGRTQLFTIIHDVTERKLAEQTIRESEEKFALTFQQAPTLMTLSEVETGTYLDVNEAFQQISGYTREEALGRTSIEVGWITPSSRERMTQALAENGHITGLAIETLAKDGRTLTCLLNAELVPINGRKRLLAAALDITALVKAQQQLEHAQRMDSLGNLAGGVAHDMNNVLGAILALASTQVAAHPEASTAHRAFDTIAQAALRGGEMVKRLLTFARRSPAELQDLELNGILREEVLLLERTTLARIRLQLELADDLPRVRGDASALTHAIMNLCVNAVDAMAGNGTLTLRTRNVEGRWAEVAVTDTGAGMPRAVLDRALDPYFTTKPAGQGTGLGLTMVYSTVKAHGGEMDLASEEGHGTTVRIRFPASAPTVAQAPAAAAPASLESRTMDVLLVDDDELMQESIAMMLEIMGHRVTTADCGERALELLEAGLRPEVVILDMNMPGLGGAGTLPRMQLLRPGLPVILATGRTDQTALDLVDRHGNVALLPKPFALKDLQAQFRALGTA
jgi:PAS domain S-box-containing protein